jgi:hypothetical protein
MSNAFMRTPRRGFSDYIVYVDESGDHSLESIDRNYPVFVLAFCIFEKQVYASTASPDLQRFKFRHFGHDQIVLHEKDIARQTPPFTFLVNTQLREAFFTDLNTLIERAPFTLIAVAIDKVRHRAIYNTPEHPYHLALEMGLERVCSFLEERGQHDRVTHVIFERRGPKEDAELELEFRRMTGGANTRCGLVPLEIVMCPKTVNSCGLQLADLVARPIGRHVLNPSQPNRSFDILSRKFRQNPSGAYHGWGLKVFPPAGP